MDIYSLKYGLQIDLETDDAEFEKLSSDYDEVDHELLLENNIGNKIYWDARLRAIYRGTCIDRSSIFRQRKPALLVSLGFEFHPSPKRRFKSAQVEIDFCPVSAGGQRPRIVSFGPKLVTGTPNDTTSSRSVGFTLKTPEPVAFAEGTTEWTTENNATNCMRIEGSCRSQGTRLVWTLAENPNAGLGFRGLPAGFEVAFLVICEEPANMSVHVRDIKVGWGVFDRERYMSRKYWPVTSYAREFLLDPDDRRHEPPPNGSGDMKGEDIVAVVQKNGRGLILG